MKKNKKLFAILTLVAFMMTLVPALAFAADTVAVDITTVEATDATTVNVYFGSKITGTADRKSVV